MRPRHTPAGLAVPPWRYEITQYLLRNPGGRCWLLAGLGRRLSIYRIRVGRHPGRRPMAESGIHHGSLGVVDFAARRGKLYVAGGVNDSTQGRIRIAS